MLNEKMERHVGMTLGVIGVAVTLAIGVVCGVALQNYKSEKPISAQALANRDSCLASITAMAERNANSQGGHVMKLHQVIYVSEANDGIVCSAQFDIDRDGKREISTGYTSAVSGREG
ncbi:MULTISPECIES: hypothetical protein [Pseudomonas]|uniref:hypothetical protein n=1 Tax=Pseudomonas TaxID=286 RepID=UPI002911CC47|nr:MULTISPECIES: hypothetical protein [Pseudomonas]MDU8545706.1 hypothetical protein [Pseudomonas syringae group sp. J248-6]WPP02633.1 hypothetical protein SFA35_26400 [Pseudomonas sp. HR96]